MKKLFIILLFILAVSGCSKHNISETLLIASIGFQKYDEADAEYKYYAYFYLPLSSDVGKSENTESKGQGEYARTKGNSIEELFKNVSITTPLEINFKHVSSVIINHELLEEGFIQELIDYVKFSLTIDYNFYIFSTKEKITDIYDFKNPNLESVLNSILVITNKEKDIYLVASPIHFLEFSRKYLLGRNIFIPMLTIEDLWTIEGEVVKNFYALSAVYLYQNKKVFVEKNDSSPYVKSTKFFDDKIKKDSIEFNNYKLSLDFKNDLVIKVSFKYEINTTSSTLTEEEIISFVEDKMRKYYAEFKDIDPLDLNYYNSVLNKNYSYDNITYDIKCRAN